jgi:hypothetical protein
MILASLVDCVGSGELATTTRYVRGRVEIEPANVIVKVKLSL